MNLSNTQLFRGLEEHEITSLLSCLNTVTRSYKKGEIILLSYWIISLALNLKVKELIYLKHLKERLQGGLEK